MFAPSIAFVDLETTGTTALGDRVTEIGIVRVDDGKEVSEWSTLVNPECSIPAGVQVLTGITNAMVAKAPTFRTVADEVAARIAGCVMVAHNARFDYGFLKREFARLGRAFTAKVLCTVKLSRRLYPEAGHHNLDAVIARHALPIENRHRALGDARILWAFLQAIYRDKSTDDIDAAIRRVLKTPSLPPHSTRFPKRLASIGFTASTRFPFTSGKASTCASASARTFRPITAVRTICASRPRSPVSSSRRPRASWGRCCASRSS